MADFVVFGNVITIFPNLLIVENAHVVITFRFVYCKL